ncbi:glycerate kinase [Sediminibacillus albus]|uniref:Glycerate kinase n=1 Tax=Sediminibacillus albus TaxID=407036 RepID=A0A1G9C811_9BACI|nr:glycerate kinase [Sediminibacillus albus]SDK47802.1 glycerate kinase [Sediminibacillus albus]
MKILIAPDSFKGSITSTQAAQAVSRAVKELDRQAEVIELPMADGGEGTVDAVLVSRGGEKITCMVEDPLGRRIEADYGWIKDESTAVIETAAASGLPLLTKEELNPMLASSYGTGQLISDALKKGATTIILGLGGSATVDGGVGLFQALGLKVFDQQGKELQRVGGNLQRISSIDTSALNQKLTQAKVIVASDVTNPLLGSNGAVSVFGPQKGVTAGQYRAFEDGMSRFAAIVNQSVNRNKIEEAGSGAAGGIGFLLHSLLNAEFRSGVELMLEISKWREHVGEADIVLTGEGKIDGQSLFGKVPVGIARAAKKENVPVVAFAGTIGEGLDRLSAEGIITVIPIVDKPMKLTEAMATGEELLYEAAKRVMHLILLGQLTNKKN